MSDDFSDIVPDEKEEEEEDGEIDPTIADLLNEEKESAWAKAWRYWKYAWTVIRNLIVICLIVFAYNKMTTAFETLVLSALILIYQSVANTFSLGMRIFVEEAHVNRGMLIGLYKKLKDPSAKEAEKTLSNIVKEYEKSTAFFYINGVFSFIIYLFVLWKIFSTLLF